MIWTRASLHVNYIHFHHFYISAKNKRRQYEERKGDLCIVNEHFFYKDTPLIFFVSWISYLPLFFVCLIHETRNLLTFFNDKFSFVFVYSKKKLFFFKPLYTNRRIIVIKVIWYYLLNRLKREFSVVK